MYSSVQNMNPSVGPVIGGKQSISVYDKDLGNFRTMYTTPDKVDKFIAQRKEVLSKEAGKGLGVIAAATALGTGLLTIASRHTCPHRRVFYGAVGALLGYLEGVSISRIMHNSADKKISKEFIKQNT